MGRPRFLAMIAIILAALCVSQASACTGEPQCCLVRRLQGYDIVHRRRRLASSSRAAMAESRRRRLNDCANDDCKATNIGAGKTYCDNCRTDNSYDDGGFVTNDDA